MIIKRSKLFAGYGETMMGGANYIGAQVGDNFLKYGLNPLNEGIDYIDENLPFKPRSFDRIKSIVKPSTQLIKDKTKKLKNKKKKEKK